MDPVYAALSKTTIYRQIKKDELTPEAYACGMLLGAGEAMCVGIRRLSVIEFGVFRGDGLRALVAIGDRISAELPVEFQYYGFDSFAGLPAPIDYRDHPEIWHHGQLHVPDPATVLPDLRDRVTLIEGDMSASVGEFVKARLSSDAPVGFVSLDCDLYTSAVSCLKAFRGPADCYLPTVPMYVDDCNYVLTYCEFAGESLAIAEFNRDPTTATNRKIGHRMVRQTAGRKLWHYNFHFVHVLDHPVRNGTRPAFPMELCVDWF